MKFKQLWTIIWSDTRETVPAIDDGCLIMAFRSKQEADNEAARQTEMYGDEDGRAVSEPIEIGE